MSTGFSSKGLNPRPKVRFGVRITALVALGGPLVSPLHGGEQVALGTVARADFAIAR